jgi:ATP-dependent Clp endopeptidase proteolytic subunit ClpP
VSRAVFRRPDGKTGTYSDWLAEISARWNALPLGEQHASRDAACARLAAGIRAQDGGPALMHLYDEIGFFGVWPADVVDALSGIKGDVEVHLNSPGGSVFDGLTIYNTLREHPGNVGVVVDGLAASAASFIAMAASPGQLEMTPNGTVMIHEAWGGCVGPAADMRATADVLEQQTANIASIYAERGGRTVPEYLGLMAAETWAVGQEAVDLGLADRVRKTAAKEAPPALAASLWQVTILNTPAPEPPIAAAAADDMSDLAGMPAWLTVLTAKEAATR